MHVVFVHYQAGFFIFVAQRELACSFLHHRQSTVSDVMLLIACALVLLIHGDLFDSWLCTFFGCYSLSLLFQIQGSYDYTHFCFDLQVELSDDDACNASSWDFDMTLDSPRTKSIDNNRQELHQPPCAASPRRYSDNEHRHHQAFNPSAASHGAYLVNLRLLGKLAAETSSSIRRSQCRISRSVLGQ